MINEILKIFSNNITKYVRNTYNIMLIDNETLKRLKRKEVREYVIKDIRNYADKHMYLKDLIINNLEELVAAKVFDIKNYNLKKSDQKRAYIKAIVLLKKINIMGIKKEETDKILNTVDVKTLKKEYPEVLERIKTDVKLKEIAFSEVTSKKGKTKFKNVLSKIYKDKNAKELKSLIEEIQLSEGFKKPQYKFEIID